MLVVASTRLAMPRAPVPARFRRLILPRQRDRAEERLRRTLAAEPCDLLISLGFAAAADHRMRVGDLLLATRAFGGPDVYLELPAAEAPGATRGSVCSLPLPLDVSGSPGLTAPLRRRRLPPVYAFDDSAFWLSRLTQALNVPCLVLRAICLDAEDSGPDPLIFGLAHLGGLSLSAALLKKPARWSRLATFIRAAGLCRQQLATTLSILLMLEEQRSGRARSL